MYKDVFVFGLSVPMFNLMVGMGILLVVLQVLSQMKAIGENVEQTKILSAFPFALLTGAVFAHIFDVIAHAGFLSVFTASFFKFGIAFLGGLFGAILYFFVHSKIAGISFVFLLNFYLPLFAIGQALGRIGCFLGGCCFGKPCAIGFVYPAQSLPFELYGAVPIFPIQLLEAFYLFCLFFLLKALIPFRFRAAVYLMSISFARFLFEFFRGDDRGAYWNGYSPSQVLGMLLFCLGVILLFNQWRRSRCGYDK